MAESSTKPDVQQLAQEKLPEVAFPATHQDYRVFLEPAVHDAVWKHASEDTSVEICGVLVGRYVRDDAGPFVLIDGSIRGEKATSKFAEVTFTHDTWAKIHEQMDSKFADRVIVGWYHSHPDFGIFLSDRDRFIQEHFFSSPGQVAYVVDPIRKTEGIFIWRKGKVALTEHYWVGGRVQVPTASGEEKPAKGAAAAPAAGGAPQSAPAELPVWVNILTYAGLALTLFILGYLAAGKINEAQVQRMELNALARAAIQLKVRPGLSEETLAARAELAAGAKRANALAEQHLRLAENAEETKKEWLALAEHLNRAASILTRLRLVYGMTPEETAALERLLGGPPPKLPEPKDEKTEPAKADTKPKEEKPKDKTEEKPKDKTEEKPKDKS